jgi:hypothetical protein
MDLHLLNQHQQKIAMWRYDPIAMLVVLDHRVIEVEKPLCLTRAYIALEHGSRSFFPPKKPLAETVLVALFSKLLKHEVQLLQLRAQTL